ncbi:MAG: hypothetical protein Q8O82_10975 [Pseudorhodobacter sp.]|nr:hypothetical protein [Pseudorhodobacter sp.]
MTESDDNKRQDALKRLRERRGTAAGKPTQLLAQPGPAGGAAGAGGAGGGKLRALLANRAGGAAAGAAGGGNLRALLANRAGGGAAGAGGAGGGKLRALLAQRLDGGDASATADRDPEALRALLRERIEKLQARLDDLESAPGTDGKTNAATDE